MMQLPLFEHTAAAYSATKRNDVRTGKSGEHLVLAKLTRWGFDAHDAPQDAPYDIIIDHHGRIVRIQVKTRSNASGTLWHYRVQRGNWRSATGVYAYTSNDYDIFAAVANSIERVLFLPAVVHATSFRSWQFLEHDAEHKSWMHALHEVERRISGSTERAHARTSHESTIA